MVGKRPRIEGVTGRFIWKPYKKSRLTKRRGVAKKKRPAKKKRYGGPGYFGPWKYGKVTKKNAASVLTPVDPYKDLVLDQEIQANREILRREAEERKKKKNTPQAFEGWMGM